MRLLDLSEVLAGPLFSGGPAFFYTELAELRLEITEFTAEYAE